jgi:hypothetical protein
MVAAADVTFKGKLVTVKKIVDAVEEFNRAPEDKRPRGGKTFALWLKGESYPPKEILSLASNRSVSSFGGGEETNRVFRALGFRICAKPDGRQENGTTNASQELKAKEKELFSKIWKKLCDEDLEKTINEPGVYVLACTPKSLEGKRVTTEDIFYVGMSNHAGVNKRLRQFLDAADGKGGHSAGTRYYKKYKRHGIYREATIYVATVSYSSCEMGKRRRTPNELQKMGIVAALEMFVMARVKKETRCEPELNLQ